MHASTTSLIERLQAVRTRSMQLVAHLSPEVCQVQSMPDASPVKWHLAHTTWFFETLVLEPFEPGFRPFHPDFRVWFNSYYNAVGDKHPRPQRGLLLRPSLAEVHEWRQQVDARLFRLLSGESRAEVWDRVALGIHHEEQHQELMLTDAKHLLACHPQGLPLFEPGGHPQLPALGHGPDPVGTPSPAQWLRFAGGLVDCGRALRPLALDFAFDNESPSHKVWLNPYTLADRLVTVGEWADFVAQGGYRDPALWLSAGWDWVHATHARHPWYWRDEQASAVFTLAGWLPVQPGTPVLHINFYEADAYARWAGARLPTEAEWEHAVSTTAKTDGSSALYQCFGAAWQWTASPYVPYPGYRPWGGAVGEYNGKFMCDQWVLRGSSFATPPDHARTTYRNFFPADAQWQFTGVRLAKDGA